MKLRTISGVLFLLSAIFSAAQTPVALAPVPQLQFFTQTGLPLAFGCVFTYQVGTTTPLATYTDYTGVTLNANPVILSGGGSANIWLISGQGYSFRVKSSGGSNCSSGSTLYTVNGIGLTGSTVLTTAVPYSASPTFTDAAQNQLFTMTLTGNATSNPLTFVGVTPPGLLTFQLTQDGSGSHTFSWPSNLVGGCTIASAANSVTTQDFIYNGTDAVALGPCVTGNGPAINAGLVNAANVIDAGLTASLPICTDTNKQLTSTCTGLIPNADLANFTVTFNGQAVALGASGNVNPGNATHSLALNEGNGNQLGALAMAADSIAVGVSSADPAAVALCTGSLKYSTSTHLFTCQPANANGAGLLIQSTRLTGSATTFTYPTAYTGTPSCVCSGEGGSCNIASVSNTACVLNLTVSVNDVIVVGVP